MIYIGCHLSVTNGYEAMGRTMCDFGGNTFAYFTRNPRGGKSKAIVPEDAEALNILLKEKSFGPLVAHGSYTMNLCASNETTRSSGLEMFAQLFEVSAHFRAFSCHRFQQDGRAHFGEEVVV